MQKRENLKKEWDDFIETGNDQAFYVLYGHYHDYFIYIAIQKGFSLEQAKDSVNDLFLYVFERRRKLVHIKQHHNYLVTSFLRKLFRKGPFNNLESLSTDENSMVNEIVPPVTDHFCPRPDEAEQLRQTVKNYIEQLSYSQAKMIYLKFYVGLSYEEIASANGVSVKTAYNTVLQAIVKLRKLIGPERAQLLKAAIFSLAHLFIF